MSTSEGSKNYFLKISTTKVEAKLTLNTNKTELIIFSSNNSDFGSIFYKKFSQNKNVADTLVFKLTGTLISMSS